MLGIKSKGLFNNLSHAQQMRNLLMVEGFPNSWASKSKKTGFLVTSSALQPKFDELSEQIVGRLDS